MSWLRDWLWMVGLATWTGSGLFFTFVGTPAVFARFERAMAGEVVGAMFPGYYQLAVVSCGLWAAMSLWRWSEGRPAAGWVLGLAVVALVLNSVGAFVLQPRIHELRLQLHAGSGAPPPALQQTFGRLHGLSMALNLLSLLAGLAGWMVVAGRGV